MHCHVVQICESENFPRVLSMVFGTTPSIVTNIGRLKIVESWMKDHITKKSVIFMVP